MLSVKHEKQIRSWPLVCYERRVVWGREESNLLPPQDGFQPFKSLRRSAIELRPRKGFYWAV